MTLPLKPKVSPQVRPGASRAPAAWSDRRIGLALAVAIAAVAGLLTGWLLPRGPITVPEALAMMIGALLVGLAAGFVSGTRWSLLATPIVALVAFELARLGTPGPTVDGVHLGSTYGIIAFVVGRGVTWLLAVLPLVLGAIFGVELAARLGRERTHRLGLIGWVTTGLAALVYVGLLLVVAPPPSTAPVIGADGQPPEGSIAELTTVIHRRPRAGPHDPWAQHREPRAAAPGWRSRRYRHGRHACRHRPGTATSWSSPGTSAAPASPTAHWTRWRR